MSHERFELATFPLDGMRLIEASAGTGKTFSLAGLFLRLLVEKRLDVRDILVMTFTRAATQELRERIRERLAVAARIAARPDEADPDDVEQRIAAAIIDAAAADEPRASIARRLRDAAARMDDAAISTIHGFAQQAARENAFDSGLPFDRGVQVDDTEVHREAVTDYWRSHVLGRPEARAAAFLELWPDPDSLLEDLAPALSRPHLEIAGPTTEDLAALTSQASTLWERPPGRDRLANLLQSAAETDDLLKSGALYRDLQAYGSVDELLIAIEAGLAGTASGHPALPGWLADFTDDAGARRHIKKRAIATCRPQDLELVQTLARLAPADQRGEEE